MQHVEKVKNASLILAAKHEVERLLRRPKDTLKDDIKMDHKHSSMWCVD